MEGDFAGESRADIRGDAAGLQLNVIIYSTPISACGKSALPERALQVFEEMRQDGLRAMLSPAAPISACEKSGEWVMALNL